MLYMIAILTALAAYLIGSISGAIILSRKISGEDIRCEGSKNAGTTNMLRVHGKKAAAFTLLIDVLKGVAATLIGVAIDSYILKNGAYGAFESTYLLGSMKYIAAVFAVIGHDFPIYFGLKGGKGVATSIGVVLVLDWKIGLIVLAAALIIMFTTRYVSLGSISAAVIYVCSVAVYMVAKGKLNIPYFICALILCLLIIVKHHANIVRLKNREENKLSFKSKNKEIRNNTSDTIKKGENV